MRSSGFTAWHIVCNSRILYKAVIIDEIRSGGPMSDRQNAETTKVSEPEIPEADYAMERWMCYSISGVSVLIIFFKLMDIF